jgi:hypothetical protein
VQHWVPQQSAAPVLQPTPKHGGVMHLPVWQTCVVSHVAPQPPQLCGSLPVLTHASPQHVSNWLQAGWQPPPELLLVLLAPLLLAPLLPLLLVDPLEPLVLPPLLPELPVDPPLVLVPDDPPLEPEPLPEPLLPPSTDASSPPPPSVCVAPPQLAKTTATPRKAPNPTK